MMKAEHILLSVSIKSTAVVEEPCTSLDELKLTTSLFVTCLVLSPYARPNAWWSRSHACKIVVEEFPQHAQAKSCSPFSSPCLCTTWRLDPKALALLPGFCIAVHLLSVLKAWLVQGLA
jgi:hypothetical protein